MFCTTTLVWLRSSENEIAFVRRRNVFNSAEKCFGLDWLQLDGDQDANISSGNRPHF